VISALLSTQQTTTNNNNNNNTHIQNRLSEWLW
jgi:hypothetical protein